MRDRVPIARDQRPALPGFAPVGRRYRHDGWTPERQKAFIEALADTGSVSRAAAMVNMSAEGAYYLRRQKGAEEFRRAWEAALDYGVARLKDIAFERAIEGYLVPCFVGGRLIGWRRKYNDRLLMFCLRHYGEDASGRRTRVEYFSTRAAAGAAANSSPGRGGGPAKRVEGARIDPAALSSPAVAGEGEPMSRHAGSVPKANWPKNGGGGAVALAETSHTTVRTVISGKGTAPSLDSTAALIDNFAGVELDETAREEIYRVLQDCAARRRAVEGTPDDPDELFISVEQPEQEVLVHDPGYSRPRKEKRRPPPLTDVVVEEGEFLEQGPKLLVQPDEQFRSSDGEPSWEMLDNEEELERIEEAVASVKKAKARKGDGL